MDADLAWAIIGLGLVIVELLTGTFYLLVLAIAAFGAAAAAWLGQGFPVQVIIGSVIGTLGCYGVHVYREKNKGEQMASVDAGQPANFESWLDQGARIARVRYRGASWEAVVDGDAAPEPGAVLYVHKTEGNTLRVAARRPG
jgi:membrane protein implicated in regulation of membrane protease activity